MDTRALLAFMDARIPGGTAGEITVQLVPGGRSNPTYEVTDGVSFWILRRPPYGQVLPTAHDMGREFRVMSALRDTAVPVPRTVALCEDGSVIGAPFYLMQRLDGRTLRNQADTGRLSAPQQFALGQAVVTIAADLHEVDAESVGLAEFGRPEGYLERQVRRWRKQWAGAHTLARPEVDLLLDRLGASVPVTRYPGIVHGDLKIDNLMVDRNDPSRVIGVLDWEMSTLGDTLADLGTIMTFWDEESRPFNPVSAGLTAHPGFPARDAALQMYATTRGIDLPNVDWYVVLAYLKVAIILEQIHTRHLSGLTVGGGFDDAGAMVQPLLDFAMEWASSTSVPALRV
ncbi:MAG: phosphotransferase family protein [Candidatus Nanopelagicales bacterium]